MWNERYAGQEYLFGTAPAQFMDRLGPHIAAGQSALCVADGEGRNSVWLAVQGLDVTAFDFAPNAVDKAKALAQARGVRVDIRQGDVTSWDWQAQTFDLVIGVFIQFFGAEGRSKIFEGMKRAIAPGGLIALHGYTPKQLEYRTGGPGVLENLYTEDLLAEAFAGYEILRLESYEAEVDEGVGHRGRSALIDLIARHPG